MGCMLSRNGLCRAVLTSATCIHVYVAEHTYICIYRYRQLIEHIYMQELMIAADELKKAKPDAKKLAKLREK